jgi:hypothetical protein
LEGKKRDGEGRLYVDNGVEKSNEASLRVLEKVGFVWVAEERVKDWYGGPDVVLKRMRILKPEAASSNAYSQQESRSTLFLLLLIGSIVTHLQIFNNRSFCITEPGRCGWVTDVSIPGDVVAVFAGHDVPIIIIHCQDSLFKVAGDIAVEEGRIKWLENRIFME